MRNELLISLYKMPQTVFTFKEITMLFPGISFDNLKERMSYFAKKGYMKKVRRGVYVKDEYDLRELANKLYPPSYISLETVLQKAGITFQYYETIFAVSYVTRTIEVDGHAIQYQRMRKDILLNNMGVNVEGVVPIASPERAFLDAIFIYKNYHFDNLEALNWDKVMELKDIYSSKVFTKRVEDYNKDYKEEYVKS